MVQFTEQACDWEECLDKIREHYGEHFTILSRKTIRLGGIFGLFTREGIEVTGYVSGLREKAYPGQATLQGLSGPVTGSPVTGTSTAPSSGVSRETTLRDEQRGGPGSPPEPLAFEEAKRRVLAAAGKDLTMQQVLSTVQEIKENISRPPPKEEHSNLRRLRDYFILNDFSPGYQDTIVARIKKSVPWKHLKIFRPSRTRRWR